MIINSDAKQYGGSGIGNFVGVDSNPVPYHGENYSINIVIPPMGIVMISIDS